MTGPVLASGFRDNLLRNSLNPIYVSSYLCNQFLDKDDIVFQFLLDIQKGFRGDVHTDVKIQ